MIPHVPPRDNRVLQTVRALRTSIFEGGFEEGLPGEAALAQSLSVSRVTLRKALTILEDEKLISPTRRGCRRRVLFHSPGVTHAPLDEWSGGDGLRGKTVTTVSPFLRQNLPAVVTLEHARLQALCADAGIHLQFAQADLSRLQNPDHRLSEFVKQNPSDLYVLLLSTQKTQQWFEQQGIPAIVQGTAWPECGLPCVDMDQRAIGLHAAQMLARMGHSNAGLLWPVPSKQGMICFEQGFHQGPRVNLIKAEQDDSPERVLVALQSLIHRDDPPSVIILPRIPYVTMASTYLLSLGLRIPQDISLLSLVYDRFFEYYYPTIAGYSAGKGAVAKSLFSVIREMLAYPEIRQVNQVLIMPDFMKGNSLADRVSN